MRVLLVTYTFPPHVGASVLRVDAMARELPLHGIDMEVLTVANPPSGVLDNQSSSEITVPVHRAWSLEPMRVMQAVRKFKGGVARREVPAHPQDSAAASQAQDKRSGIPASLIQAIQSRFIPDEKIGWLKPAVKKGLEVLSSAPFDLIVASGPPYTSFLVAHELSKRTGIPFALDMRDPWVGNQLTAPRKKEDEAKEQEMERTILNDALFITTVTPSLSRLYQERYPQLASKIHTVFNGYRISDISQALIDAEPDSEKIRVVYTGTFPTRGHSAEDFLIALAALLQSGEINRELLSVEFIGANSRDLKDLVATLNLADVVSSSPPVSHAESLAQAASADVLLYLQGEHEQFELVLGGKFAEYLALGRHIFGVVYPEGDAEKILSTLNRATLAHAGDSGEIAFELGNLLKGRRSGKDIKKKKRGISKKERIPSLAWKHLMGTYAHLIKGALE